MKRIILLFVIHLVAQTSFSQTNTTANFPESYFGIYTGELIINSEKDIKIYPMKVHLLPTDSSGVYNYMIVYGKDEQRSERKYTLKEIDKEKGIYLLDELNGIKLGSRVVGNKMYFLFQVNDSLLTTFVTFENDHLYFVIIATVVKNKKVSGGQDEETPEVFSYPIDVVQKAILIKQ